MEQGTLSIMASYNFNEPIYVSIIFEDNDESENMLTKSNNKIISETAKENVQLNNFDNITMNKTVDDVSGIRKRKSKSDYLLNAGNKRSHNNENYFNSKYINSNKTIDVIKHTFNAFSKCLDKNSSHCDIDTRIQELMKTIMWTDEREHNTTEELLELLADYLMYILKINDILACFQAKFNYDLKALEVLNEIYSRIISCIFNMAYSIIINVVEAKKNTSFTQIFLQNTFERVNETFPNMCTYKSLEKLYNGIVKWALMKRRNNYQMSRKQIENNHNVMQEKQALHANSTNEQPTAVPCAVPSPQQHHVMRNIETVALETFDQNHISALPDSTDSILIRVLQMPNTQRNKRNSHKPYPIDKFYNYHGHSPVPQNTNNQHTLAGNHCQLYQQHCRENSTSNSEAVQFTILRPSYLTSVQQYETPIQDNRVSATSRDSEIGSPVPCDGSLTPSQIVEDGTQNMPFITHVTSYNPNATFIDVQTCLICGKLTRKKCIGCYDVYYCSDVCQNIHWPSHRIVCPSGMSARPPFTTNL